MKPLAFAFLSALALAATPASAQMGGTPGNDLIDAIKKSDGDKATEILQSHPEGLVNTKDGDGNTGLIITITRGDDKWTGFLLNKGADPNLAGKAGDTPLIAAARVGFEEATEWLIGLGAKIDASNRMGETPLIIAVQQRNLQMVKMLISHGANPDKTDSAAGYSAREYAQRDPRAREILSVINLAHPQAAAGAAK